MGHKARFYDYENSVYFHLTRPSIAGVPAIPFEWYGPATPEQKAFYKAEYEEYIKLKATDVSSEMSEAARTLVDILPTGEE